MGPSPDGMQSIPGLTVASRQSGEWNVKQAAQAVPIPDASAVKVDGMESAEDSMRCQRRPQRVQRHTPKEPLAAAIVRTVQHYDVIEAPHREAIVLGIRGYWEVNARRAATPTDG